MASFDDLVRRYTALEPSATGHLKRLVGSWGLLADFCFADLLLFVPVAGEDGQQFVVLGQIRPTTSQTLYRDDLVGRLADEGDRPLVARCWRLEQIIDGEIQTPQGERARAQCIPVRWKGRTLAVLTRESAPNVGRRPGELERVYLGIFEQFARMIVEGEFPFATYDSTATEVPRVGDGVITLDEQARVVYASPNAVSALHRVGISTNAEGMRLSELGFHETVVRSAFAFGVPVAEEIEHGPDISVMVRCIPLLRSGRVDAAVVLIRDVSDLRRRDRLLLSKEAAIREIHHRVKNNLQTISSLLRLQARRTQSEEARAAIEDSVRRIRSIALVHETLSRTPGEVVVFDDIVRPLVRMVEEGLLSDERPVHVEVHGTAGDVPGGVATPLAVVLTELMQNAVDHAFGDDPVEAGRVVIELAQVDGGLHVIVRDNGAGFDDAFRPEHSSGLGLTIVRALVESELGGTIVLRSDAGAVVELDVPTRTRATVDEQL